MNEQELLDGLRRVRSFSTAKHTKAKITAINRFFRQEKLDAVTLGISGGIDSAVTATLLVEAALKKGSPIKKIGLIKMPCFHTGASDQHESVIKANLLVDWLVKKHGPPLNDLVTVIIDLMTPSVDNLDFKNFVDRGGWTYTTPYGGEILRGQRAWALGQALPMFRTTNLYFHAALLQTLGYKSIVCGTINRDEGAYIGYYGKGSDAMVDLQPLADLHKSEVYAIARYLGLPKELTSQIPAGDVWDGRTDFEMIGASYDQIELFSLLNSCRLNHAVWGSKTLIEMLYTKGDWWFSWSPSLRRLLQYGFDRQGLNQQTEDGHIVFKQVRRLITLLKKEEWWQNIERLHKVNEHKYKVGYPSRFIDVLPRGVKGGWND